jgi:uncharacterized protein (DUF169 family)
VLSRIGEDTPSWREDYMMADFVEETDRVVKTLGLEWTPVAVSFSNSADERGDSARKIRVCEAFDAVRREKTIISFSLGNCICPGGKHYTGLGILPLETMAAIWTKTHRAYGSMETALASVKRQPQPQKRGNIVTLCPLEKTVNDPDLVVLFANPEQADRALSLVSYNGAEPFTYYPVSNICSVITNTMAKGRPEINFLCSHARKLAKWSPNELMIALPFPDFQAMVHNIPFSGYGAPAAEILKH